jgi:hypothetical protein
MFIAHGFLWFISDQDEFLVVDIVQYLMTMIDLHWVCASKIWGATPMLSGHTIQMFHPNLPLLRSTDLQKGPNWLKVTHLPGAARTSQGISKRGS